MKSKILIAVRVITGLIYFVFGWNKFLGFIPMPEMPPAEGAFMGALAGTGFMFPLIAIVEIVTGALFIVGRYTFAAAAVMMPVTLIIFLTHAFLAPAGLPMATFLLGGNLLVILSQKEKLQTVLA